MDYFSEDLYGEGHGDFEDLDRAEVEAALYSAVHHCDDTYDTGPRDASENYVISRNKADRWERMKDFESSKPFGNTQHFYNKTPYHAAFNRSPMDNNVPHSQNYNYKQHRMRGQGPRYSRGRNNKPWNSQDRFNKSSRRLGFHFQSDEYEMHSRYSDPRPLGVRANLFSFGSNNSQDVLVSPRADDYRINMTAFYGASEKGVVCNNEGQNNNNSEGCSTSAVGVSSSICTSDEQHPVSTFTPLKAEQRVQVLETTESEICVISDSDSNTSQHSILPVAIPPKPSPPVVTLDSSEEDSNLTSALPVINVSPLVPESTCTTSNTENFTNAFLPTAKANDTSSQTVNPVNISPKSFKKSICKKLQKMDKPYSDLLTINSRSKAISKKNKKKLKFIECNNWTKRMAQFYNLSWGGESYDHVKLQRNMSDNPSKWVIREVDKYGPIKDYNRQSRVRCANCNQIGHKVKDCPDPEKIICCSMCGERGHWLHRCPRKMCLKCGRPSAGFNDGCPACWEKNHPRNCSSCGANDHFNWLCPNEWRKFHSITTIEDFEAGVVCEPRYKSQVDLVCCICTQRGHEASFCSFKQKQPLPQSQSKQFYFPRNSPKKKKKKKKRHSFHPGKDKQREFSRKRRKTN